MFGKAHKWRLFVGNDLMRGAFQELSREKLKYQSWSSNCIVFKFQNTSLGLLCPQCLAGKVNLFVHSEYIDIYYTYFQTYFRHLNSSLIETLAALRGGQGGYNQGSELLVSSRVPAPKNKKLKIEKNNF